MKKKKLKKNPSNRKPISYSTEFRLDINLNNLEESCAQGRGGEERRGRDKKNVYVTTFQILNRRAKEKDFVKSFFAK